MANFDNRERARAGDKYLSGANLRGANLRYADLVYAKLDYATILSGSELDCATLPDNWQSIVKAY